MSSEGRPAEKIGAEMVAERNRQTDVEGYSPAHDDGHPGEMARAAGCYATTAGEAIESGNSDTSGEHLHAWQWPWEKDAWKPKNARRDLIRAGALIIAEIERLDRKGLIEVKEATMSEQKPSAYPEAEAMADWLRGRGETAAAGMIDKLIEKLSDRSAYIDALPCPFCASERIIAWKSEAAREPCWVVFCEVCEAEGPHLTTEGDAVNAWNCRPGLGEAIS